MIFVRGLGVGNIVRHHILLPRRKSSIFALFTPEMSSVVDGFARLAAQVAVGLRHPSLPSHRRSSAESDSGVSNSGSGRKVSDRFRASENTAVHPEHSSTPR